jgi:hypothetical protein
MIGSKTSDQMRTPAVPATCDLMSGPTAMPGTASSAVPSAAPRSSRADIAAPPGSGARFPRATRA